MTKAERQRTLRILRGAVLVKDRQGVLYGHNPYDCGIVAAFREAA